ncbi:MAG: enoyl-CoA hydratase/isomerase family protein [Melioribacteraceae bacterium]|nr:enoyl-CoA hydratase/isomerase family protein [Melioribacteraceae bacterium]MCF8356803.1 enoyl-CoA hydratase/isomerase family protein [Melioribacteraceae bacterium]MCF8394982.1 enoyl-CoA hydratase/isomerase family protein [Melioribacteraceae bacterium]MCF8419702.1 enoyl-CoA hydratase/isomerase family protein [Melioribacteraceae bacterium]
MKKIEELEFELDEVKCYLKDDIAVLKLKCNAFDSLTKLENAYKVLPWFDTVEKNDKLKGILSISERNCLGEDAYGNFLSKIAGRDLTEENSEGITHFEKAEIRAIEINMLVNVIRKIVNFKKIYISAVNGEIVTPFFGMALASDFRFFSDDIKILFAHAKFGLHPSGLLPFTLPKFLNQQLVVKYLLKGGIINAEEAKKFELGNEFLPQDDFENKCVETSHEYIDMKMHFLKSTKSLIYHDAKAFEDYVKLESNYIYK